jgi:hypothetical protein
MYKPTRSVSSAGIVVICSAVGVAVSAFVISVVLAVAI